MSLYRVKARWSGFTGSPGYSIFHFDTPVEANTDGAQLAVDAVAAFMGAPKAQLPSVVRINVEGSVEVINETTGQLESMLSTTAPAAIAGTGSGPFSSAVGACVTWDTVGVRNGRRVRGRTFFVPLDAQTAFQTDGTLSSTVITNLQTAAQALVDHPSSFMVYARPKPLTGEPGDSFTVTGGRISDKTAVLRSRRD